MEHNIKPLTINASDREYLKAIIRKRNSHVSEALRAKIVLLAEAGCSNKQIAWQLSCSTNTVQRWQKRWKDKGLEGLKDKPRSGHPLKISSKQIMELLHHSPRIFSVNRSSWSCDSLAEVYKKKYGESVSKSTISRHVNLKGYKFSKAKQVLTSPDPNYREKVELLLKTLQSLKPDEMFFFIDEMGPLRIRKYGGRCYVEKGKTLTIPQNQIPKGSITLLGALSATTNQMTWFYGKSKDTSAMIDLVEILFNQYHDRSKIYITWDAASWHKSNELIDWLDKFNAQTKITGKGPIIELVPLPKCSQFLDVIEAVFSGMKRAVIHHSDYQSEEEMKLAISKHFQDRNEYFTKNPKRVGKKIWEIDFFKDYNNIKAGNYREW